uniref:Uncharacterized protein n=1 Tax=Rhizophora mucronata TaxID=61149 RepID=A0A2P2Q8H8_RHIMU
MSNHGIGIEAVPVSLNFLAISTTLTTSIVQRLLQCVFRNTWLSHAPQLLYNPSCQRCWCRGISWITRRR